MLSVAVVSRMGDDEEAGEEEDDEEYESFELMTTSGHVQVVEIDPALHDRVHLKDRLPRNRLPSFWDRARSVFLSSAVAPSEVVDAAREGEVSVERQGKAPLRGSLLVELPEEAEAAEEEEEVKEEEEQRWRQPQQQQQPRPQRPPSILDRFMLGTPRMSEEKVFSHRMDAEWQKYLDEEIALLRIERMAHERRMATESTALGRRRTSSEVAISATASDGDPLLAALPVSSPASLASSPRPRPGATRRPLSWEHTPTGGGTQPPSSEAAAGSRKLLGAAGFPEAAPDLAPGPWRASPSGGASLDAGADASGVKEAVAAAEAAAEAAGGRRIVRVLESLRRKAQGDGAGARAFEFPPGGALSTALRLGEVGSSQRGGAWLAIACADPEVAALRSEYASLVRQRSLAEREIARDMHRTFPYHEMFAEEKGAGQRKLFNVIKAYSVLDKELGYTQGMGFVAATLLMNMGEEDAFCCLAFLMLRCGLRPVFLPDMEQLQVRLFQLSQLIHARLPAVHHYFESKDIKPVVYAADWFLTLFSRSLPPYVAHRVFDVVFAERTTAIVFKLGIVLLQVCRRQLQQCQEMENSVFFLKHHMPQQLKKLSPADAEELVAKALRVELPFESLLRLEAECERLAEEAGAAANEVQAAGPAAAAAAAGEEWRAPAAAPASWASSRAVFETRLETALQTLAHEREGPQQGRNLRADEDGPSAGSRWPWTGEGREHALRVG